MNMLKQATMAMVLAVGTVGLAAAHHAANSQFDGNKNIVFTGVLDRVYLGNPHGYLYFIRTVNGQQENWTFETEAILALRRAGLSARNDLPIGSTYSLVYSPALDASKAGLMHAIKLTNGRIIAFSVKGNVVASDALLNERLLNGSKDSQQ
ncbi:MAG TPA: DUF6152 family protein [Steroidobacteraceae bacterium]|nr:DUF6152 family protein [Steroidobacteraceae bacterium]